MTGLAGLWQRSQATRGTNSRAWDGGKLDDTLNSRRCLLLAPHAEPAPPSFPPETRTAGTAEITPENLGQISIICKFEPDAVEFDKNLWR